MTLYLSLFACFDCAIHLVFVFMRIKPRSLHNNLCNMYNNYENGQIEPDLKWFLKRINLINKDHHLAIVRNYQTDPVGNYKFTIYLSHILLELGTQHYMIATQIGNYYQFKRLLLFFFRLFLFYSSSILLICWSENYFKPRYDCHFGVTYFSLLHGILMMFNLMARVENTLKQALLYAKIHRQSL